MEEPGRCGGGKIVVSAHTCFAALFADIQRTSGGRAWCVLFCRRGRPSTALLCIWILHFQTLPSDSFCSGYVRVDEASHEVCFLSGIGSSWAPRVCERAWIWRLRAAWIPWRGRSTFCSRTSPSRVASLPDARPVGRRGNGGALKARHQAYSNVSEVDGGAAPLVGPHAWLFARRRSPQ